jgi:hypothetical protein
MSFYPARYGWIVGALVLTLALVSVSPRSEADILSALSTIATGAGKVGSTAGRIGSGLSHAGAATTYLKALPVKPGVAALAALAEGDGAWRFVSATGESFLAHSPSDVSVLLQRQAAAGQKLDLHLPPSGLAGDPAMLDQVFDHASINIVGRNGATYPVRRVASADGRTFDVALRENIVVRVDRPEAIEEILGRAERGFSTASVHVLSFDGAGAEPLSGVPRWSDGARLPLPQALDPASLAEDFRLIRGHTAIVSGRIDGGTVYARRGGAEIGVPVAQLEAAARDADINLIVLSTDTAAQPGARGRLGGRVAVDNLADALASDTWADFLATLGGKDSQLVLTANPSGRTHVAIDVAVRPTRPPPAATASIANESIHVVVHAATIFARNQAEEDEREGRIIPGVPTSLAATLLINFVLGVIARDLASSLLLRVWPKALTRREQSAAHWTRAGARLLRYGVLYLILLPLAGNLIFLVWLVRLVWRIIMAPIRWLARAHAG